LYFASIHFAIDLKIGNMAIIKNINNAKKIFDKYMEADVDRD